MVSSELSHFSISSPSPMAKPNNSPKTKPSSLFSTSFIFLIGSFTTVVLVWSLWSINTPKSPNPSLPRSEQHISSPEKEKSNPAGDSPEKTFYDSPEFSYRIGSPVKNWDEKRQTWLEKNPSFAGKERIVMISGSQPRACKNPFGDHLLLKSLKNKVDYCRIHGIKLFYNNALLNPKMDSYWAKIPVIRAAMVAHPEAEWLWWVDADAIFTDMEFFPPFDRYLHHDLVVHGWAHLIHEKRSWTGLNAGVFMIRNSQWAMEFLEVWARFGPAGPEYERWGPRLRRAFPDKAFPESDDQTALAWLIVEEGKWKDRIYLESDYYLEGYWEEIVGTYDNITERYKEIEKKDERLRRRHAESTSAQYAAFREDHLRGTGHAKDSWRRPFVTHFTGCQPCSGDHNHKYSGRSCRDGMLAAFDFADNQVLRTYGFMHPRPLDPTVEPVPFGYPAT